MKNWYKLDNAAKLFPSVTTIKNSSVFRVAAILKNDVDKEILQKAVDHIFDRFPMMFVKMRTGVFWNYFDANTEKFFVREESSFPCDNINRFENNGYFLNVLYYKNRVSVEIFHSLTDGGGAIELLKSILFYYHKFLYGEIPPENKVLLATDDFSFNMKDSFNQYYEKGKKVSNKSKNSFRIRGTSFDRYGNNVITGVLSAKDLNACAKLKGATITSYLTSVLIYSIYMSQQRYINDNKPIIVTIPVNLRREFPSLTLRNFFGVANVGMVVTRQTQFDEIIKTISSQLKEKTTKESLQDNINSNVKLERSIYSKIAPMFLKKLLISLGFNFFNETKKTITISNLGNIQMPQELSKYINQLEAVLYPTPKSKINCGIITLNDKVTISFSRTIAEAEIIKYFFNYLSEGANIQTSVYSNDWGIV